MKKKSTPTILWESKKKNIEGKPFFTVKETKTGYLYGERAGIDSIFFILVDKINETFLLIKEKKPPLDEFRGVGSSVITAFGGSIDLKISNKEICQLEVKEESGYEVDLSDIYFVGSTMVSTQMNQISHGFVVDITGKTKKFLAEYETDENFKGNEIISMNFLEVLQNSDWKSIFLVSKMFELKEFKGLSKW